MRNVLALVIPVAAWEVNLQVGEAVRTPTPGEPVQAAQLMKFAAGLSPLPSGWGGPGLCQRCGPEICSAWQGVTCDFPDRVTYLNLGDNQFTGTVDLTALPSGLLQLDLTNNQFSGTVDLTALPSGLIPSGGGQLRLFLGTNNFTGTPDLTALPSGLLQLNLDTNNFTGTPDLTALPSGLRILSLYYNKFQGNGSFHTPNRWCGSTGGNGTHLCGSADASFDCDGGTWHCN